MKTVPTPLFRRSQKSVNVSKERSRKKLVVSTCKIVTSRSTHNTIENIIQHEPDLDRDFSPSSPATKIVEARQRLDNGLGIWRRRRKRRFSHMVSTGHADVDSDPTVDEQRKDQLSVRQQKSCRVNFQRKKGDCASKDEDLKRRGRRDYGKPNCTNFRTPLTNIMTAHPLADSYVVDNDLLHCPSIFQTDEVCSKSLASSSYTILPALLYLRELGLSKQLMPRLILGSRPNGNNTLSLPIFGKIHGGSAGIWTTLMLKTRPHLPLLTQSSIENSEIVSSKNWEWRLYTVRSIAFSELKTPLSDAVLGLDRSGSYVNCVGSGRGRVASEDGDELIQSFIQESGRGDAEGKSRGVRIGYYPALALRFYGVPSPSQLDMTHIKSKARSFGSLSCNLSPLLLTIPFLLSKDNPDGNRNYTVPSSVLDGGESSAVTTPIQILASRDGALGVAFLHHSSSSSPTFPIIPAPRFVASPAVLDEDILGTLFIFELPPHIHSQPLQLIGPCQKLSIRLVKSYRCANVRIGGRSAHTMRNLLWPTQTIPCRIQTPKHPTIGSFQANLLEERFTIKNATCIGGICDAYRKTDGGYLLFNDEDDGFRVLWIDTSDPSLAGNQLLDPARSQFKIVPNRKDIMVVPDDPVVDEVWSEKRTGFTPAKLSSHEKRSMLQVAFQAYLQIDALLRDILDRRRSLLSVKSDLASITEGCSLEQYLPDFYYNLVSVSNDGSAVLLVIVFGNVHYTDDRQKISQLDSSEQFVHANVPAAFGVFVRMHLLDQSYEEVHWVQHLSCYEPAFLRHWSNTLAINKRMSEMRIGPFCVEERCLPDDAKFFQKFGVKTYDLNNLNEEEEDSNIELWGSFVADRLENKECVAPKKVAMSSLYPFCDFFSNQAVISCKPVSSIVSRDSPVKLSYG